MGKLFSQNYKCVHIRRRKGNTIWIQLFTCMHAYLNRLKGFTVEFMSIVMTICK